MLTTYFKQTLNCFLHPVGSVLARCGVSASALTLATPVLIALLCLWLLLTRAVVPFCFAVTAVGCLDALDGAVARAGGQVTKAGAYLDAMCDRVVEALVAVSIAAVTGYWALSMVVLAGSFLVSYAKARAAMEVAVSNLEWPDLMERTERDLLFIAGLAASRLLPWQPLGHDLFWWTLVLLVFLIYLTVAQRTLRAIRLIRHRA